MAKKSEQCERFLKYLKENGFTDLGSGDGCSTCGCGERRGYTLDGLAEALKEFLKEDES